MRLEESGSADLYAEMKDRDLTHSSGSGYTRVQASGTMIPWKRDFEAEKLYRAADETSPEFVYLRKDRLDRAAELAWAKRWERESAEREEKRAEEKKKREDQAAQEAAVRIARLAALNERNVVEDRIVVHRKDPEWKEPNRHMLPSVMSWPRAVTLMRRQTWYNAIRNDNIRNDKALAEFVKVHGWCPDELRRSEYAHRITPMEYRDWLIQSQWQEDRKAEELAAQRLGESVARIREWVEQGLMAPPRWGDVD